jgi:hypothetical protein
MIRLVLVLLGVDYLRRRVAGLYWLGFVFMLAGMFLVVDSLDRDLYFPLGPFAALLALGGLGLLAVAALGRGGLAFARAIEGAVFVAAAVLVMGGHQRGGFWLSMIFGTLFAFDGLLQCVSATLVRFPRWRVALAGGLCEVVIALAFYTPYPFGYEGTVPFALGLALMFVGWGMVWTAVRVRLAEDHVGVEQVLRGAPLDTAPPAAPRVEVGALTVHVWMPTGAAARQVPLQRRPLLDRYVAAVDVKGAVWTGHVALGGPRLYISLDPASPIRRSLADLRMLHAAPYNNVPGHFQVDYETDERLRGPCTVRVQIMNIDADQLQRFWLRYREDTTYNLTRRNCAASVARALEAAVEGAMARSHGGPLGWRLFVVLLLSPDLWIAAQIRKRGKTMAWTPGLVLDYARALSVLVDGRRSD